MLQIQFWGWWSPRTKSKLKEALHPYQTILGIKLVQIPDHEKKTVLLYSRK